MVVDEVSTQIMPFLLCWKEPLEFLSKKKNQSQKQGGRIRVFRKVSGKSQGALMSWCPHFPLSMVQTLLFPHLLEEAQAGELPQPQHSKDCQEKKGKVVFSWRGVWSLHQGTGRCHSCGRTPRPGGLSGWSSTPGKFFSPKILLDHQHSKEPEGGKCQPVTGRAQCEAIK